MRIIEYVNKITEKHAYFVYDEQLMTQQQAAEHVMKQTNGNGGCHFTEEQMEVVNKLVKHIIDSDIPGSKNTGITDKYLS